ncbi:MAG: AMP-binding protein [Pseudomonadales bacterium]|nr:AMP-binding protein [Pseudomonadales bacterium]
MTLLENAFTRYAGRPALMDEQGVITFAELQSQIFDWTRTLDELDARRVAFRLDNSPRWPALDLALLMTDRVAVPIPQFFSQRQVEHALVNSGADLLVTDDAPPEGLGLTAALPRSGEDGLYRIENASPVPLPAETAKLTYTSGTTGTPKGVCLSADTLVATAQGIAEALEPVRVQHHMSVLPLSLLLENVAGVYANLLNGGITTLLPLAALGLQGSSGIDLAGFVAAQNRVRPESLILVPQLLLALTAAAELGMQIPTSYRFVAVGGGKVSVSLLERARRAGIPAYEGYGLTECGSVVTLNLPGADRPGSVGRPLPHAQITEIGGRIHIRKPVLRGYTGDCVQAPGCVDTGDLGHIDADGFVHVHGRASNHYISAFGRNINPEWIEGELTAELPIGTAVVFGDGRPVNVALLLGRAGADEASVTAAVDRCNARLPDYAQIAAWKLVNAEVFRERGCLTENGRPRRVEVLAGYQHELEALFSGIEEFS